MYAAPPKEIDQTLVNSPPPARTPPPPHVVCIDRCISKTIVWASYRCESWGSFLHFISSALLYSSLVSKFCVQRHSFFRKYFFILMLFIAWAKSFKNINSFVFRILFCLFFSFLFSPRRSKPAVGKKVNLVNFRIIKYMCQVSGQLNLLPVTKAFFFWILSVTLLSYSISNVSITLRDTMLSKFIIYNPALFRLFLCSTPINSYIIGFALKLIKPFRQRRLIADRGKM